MNQEQLPTYKPLFPVQTTPTTSYHVALSACLKAKPEIIYHLADIVAGVDYVFSNEPFVYRANILINTNVFAAAQEAKVPNLIYLGTACSYPRQLQEKSGGVPLIEEQVYPANPESSYGWSKLSGEYEAELIGKNSEMKVGILRLHNVYGPRAVLSKKRSQAIPSLIRKAVRCPEEEFIVWGSGKQARDFIFVGDVVEALLCLPLHGMNQGPIQISSGHETSIAEIAKMIIKISGKDIPLKFDTSRPEGDVGRSGNNDKAKRVLGWDVSTKLEDGLKQTYDWAFEQITVNKVNLDD
ncbi:MAG: NAD-dependent epimerase/dehydratase family protein [Pseudomonadota bacterium]